MDFSEETLTCFPGAKHRCQKAQGACNTTSSDTLYFVRDIGAVVGIQSGIQLQKIDHHAKIRE
jgi:hypothetical protein